ncbi:GIY-YIG nuclease family protein [Fortiea contorta]|uniref:GIY-YIG nuclease family protein n=1 Tax=Fortiea contorta TaxID=1892405 RepID=UPI00034D9D1C|nr:GIY-YIG nuclease family protein [Fortiea contorta]
MSVSLTFRCPDDLTALIASQVEVTGQDKTSVVVGMLRSNLPSLPLIDKNKLPDIPAIYFIWSSNKLLYIGKTSNLKKRFYQHHRAVNFLEAGGDTRIAWFSIQDDELPSLEQDLIELLEPDLNYTLTGQPNNIISFRLTDAELQSLQGFHISEDKSLSQTAARLLRGMLAGIVEPSTPLDIQEFKQEVEARFNELRSHFDAQLEELRGKSKAR